MATVHAVNPSPTPVTVGSPVQDRLRDAMDQVVGETFYGTLLRSLRSSSLRGPYGHGGRGEEVFQAQLDQIFATEAGRARSSSLSEAAVRRYMAQQEAIDRHNQDSRDSRDNGGAS